MWRGAMEAILETRADRADRAAAMDVGSSAVAQSSITDSVCSQENLLAFAVFALRRTLVLLEAIWAMVSVWSA